MSSNDENENVVTNRLERFRKTLFVLIIMYRKRFRKKLLKVVVLLNFVLFVMALSSNQVSMILYVLNMFYVFTYLKMEYPEESLKSSDRFKDLE